MQDDTPMSRKEQIAHPELELSCGTEFTHLVATLTSTRRTDWAVPISALNATAVWQVKKFHSAHEGVLGRVEVSEFASVRVHANAEDKDFSLKIFHHIGCISASLPFFSHLWKSPEKRGIVVCSISKDLLQRSFLSYRRRPLSFPTPWEQSCS